MAGNMIEPIATTVAGLEPEMVAKNAQARIAAIASPPRIQPTSASAKRMMRAAMPPSVSRVPDRTKNGTAMIAKLSSPVNRRCETMSTVSSAKEENSTRNVSTVIPSAIEIGVPVNRSNNRISSMSVAFMRAPPPRGRVFELATRRSLRSAPSPEGSDNTSVPSPAGCIDTPPTSAIPGPATPVRYRG